MSGDPERPMHDDQGIAGGSSSTEGKLPQGPESDWWETDPYPTIQGVLLSDAIQKYIRGVGLIQREDFDKEYLQAASYDLRLGSEYYSSGQMHNLSKDDPIMWIEPHEVVVVRTYERLNIPRYMMGRWNIRIGLLYRGIVLVSGPQVDPGFNGRLCCTLYNLSTTSMKLHFLEHIGTIDFAKTSPFHPNQECKRFEIKKRTLEDYLPPYKLQSAPADVRNLVSDLNQRMTVLQRNMYTVLSILFAAMLGLTGLIFVLSNAK